MLHALASPALLVPRTTTLMALRQHFKQTHLPVALVVDEFGGINGLVSLTDVTAAIVGELPETTGGDPWLVKRDRGHTPRARRACDSDAAASAPA